MVNLLAWAAHRIGGILLLARLILFDLLWLLPPHPSLFITMLVPRFIELSYPELYGTIGAFFDGDTSPIVWLLVVLTIVLMGGSGLPDVLFPKGKLLTSLWSYILTFVIFFAVPVGWLGRVYHTFQLSREIEYELTSVFPGLNAEQSRDGVFALNTPYSIEAHVTNAFGGYPPLVPDLTLTYKTIEPKGTCGPEKEIMDIPYESYYAQNRRELDKGNLQLDVYKPSKQHRSGKSPIILHLHGGAWYKGDRSFIRMGYHGGVPRFWLDQGFTIVSVSYRLLCSNSHVMDAIEDTADAISFVEKNAVAWNADGSTIFPFGTSAGGHLALITALQHKLKSVRGIISLYGVAELREVELQQRAADFFEASGARMKVSAFIEATRHVCQNHEFDSADACFHAISPLAHVNIEMPPILIVHGESDPLVPPQQASWLKNASVAVGVPSVLIKVPGSHDCDVHVSSPCSQATMYASERFIHSLI